jgi:hypothetical protein
MKSLTTIEAVLLGQDRTGQEEIALAEEYAE